MNGKMLMTVLDCLSGVARLLENGYSLQEAFSIYGDSLESGSTRETLRVLCRRLYSGEGAGDPAPEIIPEEMLILIDSLSRGSSLSLVFQVYRDYFRMKKKLRDTVIQSSLYPALLLLLLYTGIIVLRVVFLPAFTAAVISGAGRAPAVCSQIQHTLTLFIFGIPAGAGGIVLLVFLFGSPGGKGILPAAILHRALFSLPVVGKWFSVHCLWRCFFFLRVLDLAGNPLEYSLRVTASSFRNSHFRTVIQSVAEKISRGEDLVSAFCSGDFPDEVIRWLRICSCSGGRENPFQYLHQFYQERLEFRHGLLEKYCEPVSILFTGGFVLLIILSCVRPMLTLFGAVI